MLAPEGRALLLEALRPPLGLSLEAAVATTFTLDFSAALVAPLAFAAQEMRSTSDPIAVLEAVRKVTDRLDVFCQAGQISVPKASDLMAFLEPMVHEVRRPRPGHLFHPKVWTLKFTSADGSEQALRLLCLTRNLTSDSSWDALLRLDATVGKIDTANTPIARFLHALPGMAVTPLAPDRQERINQLAESFRRARWELPDHVGSVLFHPLGLRGPRPQLNFSGYRRLVVSPFVNDAGLRIVAPTTPEATVVVSRPEGLARLDGELLDGFDARTISPLAGLATTAGEADDNPTVGGGLHAKLYVVERNRRAHIFIGSANATDAAFNGNVEFLVELSGGATKLGVDQFIGDQEGFASLLEPFAGGRQDHGVDDDELARSLENLLRDLAEARFHLEVTTAGDAWSLHLTSARPLPHFSGDVRVTAQLLFRPGVANELVPGTHAAATFAGVATPDISPFVVLAAAGSSAAEGQLTRGTVVRAELINDPEGRLDEVLARQVDTPEKFLQFLFLLLGLGAGQIAVFQGTDGPDGKRAWGAAGAGVFEVLMRALADQPEAFESLDGLVSRLQATEAGRRILPDGFGTLWATFSQARQILGDRETSRRTA